MSGFNKISSGLLKYAICSGFTLGLLVSLPTFFLNKGQLLTLKFGLPLFLFSIFLSILLIWNYRSKVPHLDYRETFSISFLILSILTFFRYVTFFLKFEYPENNFNFTQCLISILPYIPISFLLATFLKKQN